MVNNLEKELKLGIDIISKFSEEEFSLKNHPDKWSKKEILGHLIDSAVNNLQRFTEVEFSNQPYNVRKYNQNELVKTNDYQNSETKELLNFWLAINTRIQIIIKKQTNETLRLKFQIDNDTVVDFKFLIKDYIDHLVHHLRQIEN